MVEILLDKLAEIYSRSFTREGVYFEVRRLASEALTPTFIKDREEVAAKAAAVLVTTTNVAKPSSKPGSPGPAEMHNGLGDDPADSSLSDGSPPVPRIDLASRSILLTSHLSDTTANSVADVGDVDRKPSIVQLSDWSLLRRSTTDVKQMSSVPTDPKDVNILRAKVLCIKKGLDVEASGSLQGDNGLAAISAELTRIVESPLLRSDTQAVIQRLSARLQDKESPLSSFELLQSGLLPALLTFVTSGTEGRLCDPSSLQ